MTTPRTGTCLCKAVTVTATPTGNVGACHCSMCRTWAGGPFMAIECTDVTIEGGDTVARYDSSAWAQRGFCTACGTHLFYFLKPAAKYILAAGILDDGGFVFDHQVFIDEKPDWYGFAQETDDKTGAEIFAAVTGG